MGEAAFHTSLGAVATNVLSRRPDDRIGAMLTLVDLSDAAGSAFDENEAVLELFYAFQVTRYLSVQPDLQYVANPAGNEEVDNGFVVTLRLGFDF